jgi:poly(rC)-binding protein 2/3/4
MASTTTPAAAAAADHDETTTTLADPSGSEAEMQPPKPDEEEAPVAEDRWPGWPGENVFRLIVPVLKVGSIIGRKGELVKKMCEETRARIRILEGPPATADRIVLISGKEEPESEMSPAMDAVVRVFKRISGLSPNEGDNNSTTSAVAWAAFCSVRLLVSSSQAIHLIGKQGSTIKSIQESSSATVRVLSEEEGPLYAAADERIVEVHGDATKVLKALEGIMSNLRKFLVDRSVLPVFEKKYNVTVSQERPVVDSWADKPHSLLHNTSSSAAPTQSGLSSDFQLSLKREPLFFERESHLVDSKLPHAGLSLYGQDPGLGGIRSTASTGFGRTTTPIVTQMTKTMQIPLSYAEDIIGIGGANIAYIRRTSGAILTVQESRGLPDEITVEIKGTSSQVESAEQLIQEFINTHKEVAPGNIYGRSEGLYSHLSDTSYPPPPSSYSGAGSGYGSSAGLGGGGAYGSSYRY